MGNRHAVIPAQAGIQTQAGHPLDNPPGSPCGLFFN